MNNAELITAIRENEECNNCAIWKHGECNERKMSLAAADALEAADKRIAELKLKICEMKKETKELLVLMRIMRLEKKILSHGTGGTKDGKTET